MEALNMVQAFMGFPPLSLSLSLSLSLGTVPAPLSTNILTLLGILTLFGILTCLVIDRDVLDGTPDTKKHVFTFPGSYVPRY